MKASRLDILLNAAKRGRISVAEKLELEELHSAKMQILSLPQYRYKWDFKQIRKNGTERNS